MAQIPEGTDVGDDERDAELILRAPPPEIDRRYSTAKAKQLPL